MTLLALAATAAFGVVVAACLAVSDGSVSPVPSTRAVPAEPIASKAHAAEGELPPVPAVPTSAEPTTDAPPPEAVRRAGEVLLIDFRGVPLRHAIDQLAAATHASVHGADTSAPASVALQWQGRDAAAAWQLLLGPFASFSVACTATSCDVWIVGGASAQPLGSPAAQRVPAPAAATAEASKESAPTEGDTPQPEYVKPSD